MFEIILTKNIATNPASIRTCIYEINNSCSKELKKLKEKKKRKQGAQETNIGMEELSIRKMVG